MTHYSCIDLLSKYKYAITFHKVNKYFLPSELLEYARKLGIDVHTEKQLLHIAREGLLAELPEGWRPW